jgi:hypothetical protein
MEIEDCDKRIEEALKEQLEERELVIGNLEADIVTLRKDLQKKNMKNNSKFLYDIMMQEHHHQSTSQGQ